MLSLNNRFNQGIFCSHFSIVCELKGQIFYFDNFNICSWILLNHFFNLLLYLNNENPISQFEKWGFEIHSMATSGFGLAHYY